MRIRKWCYSAKYTSKKDVAKGERDMEKEERILAYISHEIKAPIAGAYEMLNQIKKKAQMTNVEEVGHVQETLNYTMGVIEDVLHLLKLKQDNIILQTQALKLEEIVEQSLKMQEALCKKKGIACSVEYFGAGYRYLYTDKNCLLQILLNLISNAVKYTPSGGRVAVRVYQRIIEENRELLQLEIEDNGVGMSEEFLKEVFSPFMIREDVPLQGTGLGLTIVKLLVEKLGGNLDVKSQEWKGTIINFSVELDGADEFWERKEAIKEEPGTEACWPCYENKRVLLAEDDEVYMELMKNHLEEVGIEADKTYDGDEVIDIFTQAQQGYYQMIFLDMNLQEVSGFEAAKKIREFEKRGTTRIPIVGVSGYIDSYRSQEMYNEVIDGFLLKPLSKRDLYEVLGKYLGDQA